MVPPLASNKPVLLFDNVCKLCSRSVQFILRHNEDESIQFLSAQSELGAKVLAHYGMRSDALETMLYLEDGELYRKSTAAISIARRLALPWRLLQLCRIIPRPIRDWIYDRIARNRYKLFGKMEQCFLPDKTFIKRFLDE